MFLLVPAHPGSPGQRAVERLLLLLLCCFLIWKKSIANLLKSFDFKTLCCSYKLYVCMPFGFLTSRVWCVSGALQAYLTDFLRSFSTLPYYTTFSQHHTDAERQILCVVGIPV